MGMPVPGLLPYAYVLVFRYMMVYDAGSGLLNLFFGMVMVEPSLPIYFLEW